MKSTTNLEPHDFPIRKSYKIFSDEDWIYFSPDNSSEIKKQNNDQFFGYKTHIIVPKTENYKEHLDYIINILTGAKFNFKIDPLLNEEINGERAFTVYLPHAFNPNWFEAFKKIDDYLTDQFKNNKNINSFSTQLISDMNYISYRNDKDSNGTYYEGRFKKRWKKDSENPFRKELVRIYSVLYETNIELYKLFAQVLYENPGLCLFFSKLAKKNEDFIETAKKLQNSKPLFNCIFNILTYDPKNKEGYFKIAIKLIKDEALFKKISSLLTSKSNCPAYYKIINLFYQKNNNVDDDIITLSRMIEVTSIKLLYKDATKNNNPKEHEHEKKTILFFINEMIEKNKNNKYLTDKLLKALEIIKTLPLVQLKSTTKNLSHSPSSIFHKNDEIEKINHKINQKRRPSIEKK